MSKLMYSSLVVGVMLIGVGLWTTPAAQSGGTGILQGTITSADGQPMEGVTVSARASDQSFATSVFTDRQGHYRFPPLAAGGYRVRAQAVGFDGVHAEFALSGGDQMDRDFSLTPLTEAGPILKQMSGTEYLRSLPQSTPEDRRMVHVFKNNCTACHTASYTLQNRWDEHGWGIIMDLMTRFNGPPPNPNNPGNPMIRSYEEELVEYLTRVRGETELSVSDLKLQPRPTGEATQVVMTEFDLPRTDQQDQAENGSDWSMGTPSRFNGRAAHDVWVGADGNIWIADDRVPDRTIAKLDPRTGKVTNYVHLDPEGKTISTHSIAVDRGGKVWATNGNEGTFLMFDPRTEQFTNFPRQADMDEDVGGTLDVDSQGNPWATSTNGAIKLEAATGQYIYYAAPSADVRSEDICGEECGRHSTYGITIDRDDNAWITQPGLDRLVKVDARVDGDDPMAVGLAPLSLPEATAADRERRRTIRSSMNMAPPQHKAPRRNAAAPNADLVWTALYTSDRLARLDTKTNEVQEYPMPTPYTMPYATAVDKNGMVYVATINLDAIVRFDPTTEQFTEFYLPSRGTEIRHVQVDNTTDPPTVWAPYNRSNKIVRIQFPGADGLARTASR